MKIKLKLLLLNMSKKHIITMNQSWLSLAEGAVFHNLPN